MYFCNKIKKEGMDWYRTPAGTCTQWFYKHCIEQELAGTFWQLYNSIIYLQTKKWLDLFYSFIWWFYCSTISNFKVRGNFKSISEQRLFFAVVSSSTFYYEWKSNNECFIKKIYKKKLRWKFQCFIRKFPKFHLLFKK